MRERPLSDLDLVDLLTNQVSAGADSHNTADTAPKSNVFWNEVLSALKSETEYMNAATRQASAEVMIRLAEEAAPFDSRSLRDGRGLLRNVGASTAVAAVALLAVVVLLVGGYTTLIAPKQQPENAQELAMRASSDSVLPSAAAMHERFIVTAPNKDRSETVSTLRFSSLSEAIAATPPGRTILIQGDAPASTTEMIRITKAIRIEAARGSIPIGSL